MAALRALRRLLRLRTLEEDLSRHTLEAAAIEVKHLQVSLLLSGRRHRLGKSLVEAESPNGEVVDRLAGLHQIELASRFAAFLRGQIAAKEEAILLQRKDYLRRRIERRQVETLIAENDANTAILTARRTQQSLDDWYLAQIHRKSER